MNDEFARDVAVVGAGRIGLPWATVLAVDADRTVTCIDVSEERVAEISAKRPPYDEPELEAYLVESVNTEALKGTTDPSSLSEHEFVAFTLNAQRNGMDQFLSVIQEYTQHLVAGQTVICRTTIPIRVVDRMREIVTAAEDVEFVTFPERLAEGSAIKEIRDLPKVIGAGSEAARRAINDLLAEFTCPIYYTDPRTAMFVKLIDNSYRDALFAIANQIAYTAEELGLNAHEAIELANREYPRNEIPPPGPVGGKCLPKDPHFISDHEVFDQPTSPDLFHRSRRTNAYLSSHVVASLLAKRPSTVAVLGMAYKRGVSDITNSPAVEISDELRAYGVDVEWHDPYIEEGAESVETAVSNVDVIVLAVNHPEFEGLEGLINEHSSPGTEVYDMWGLLDGAKLERPYDGLGVGDNDGSPDIANRCE